MDPEDELLQLQREHGICSDFDCVDPIATWCADCGLKLCSAHLLIHQALGCESGNTLGPKPHYGQES